MTDAERVLWRHIRQKQLNGFHFRKQCPVGPYIADFACLEAKLVVELDGSQHVESPRDAVRDAWFAARGYRTLRFWNNDILPRPDGALTIIIEALNAQAH